MDSPKEYGTFHTKPTSYPVFSDHILGIPGTPRTAVLPHQVLGPFLRRYGTFPHVLWWARCAQAVRRWGHLGMTARCPTGGRRAGNVMEVLVAPRILVVLAILTFPPLTQPPDMISANQRCVRVR